MKRDGPAKAAPQHFQTGQESKTESSSLEDGEVCAVYDIVWLTGTLANPNSPYFPTGYTITIEHVVTHAMVLGDHPTSGYRAHFTWFLVNAVFSCVPSQDSKSYTNFQLLQCNKDMKEMLMKDAVTFSTVPGMNDINGNPLLRLQMNCSAGPGAEYVYREGWAKKRELVGAPLATIDLEEQAKCREYDRKGSAYGLL